MDLTETPKYTILFKAGPKKVGLRGTQLKYVARPFYGAKQSEGDTIKQIVRNYRGIQPYQVHGAIDAIVNDFQNQLMHGHPMKIAGLGTFRLSFNSASHDTPEAVTAEDIRNPHIVFIPDPELKRIIRERVVFEKVE